VELEDGDAGVDVRGHRPAQRGGDLGGEASAEPYLGVRSPVQGMGRGRRHDAYLADIKHAPVDPRNIALPHRSGTLAARQFRHEEVREHLHFFVDPLFVKVSSRRGVGWPTEYSLSARGTTLPSSSR
jgi:hypothetical protein